MSENLEKQLFEMNETIVSFLEKFSNFQKKRIINEDICFNLHKLVKSIDNYMNDDLKLSDIKFDKKQDNENNKENVLIQNSNHTVITTEEQKFTSNNNVFCNPTSSKMIEIESNSKNMETQNIQKQYNQFQCNTNPKPNITNNQQNNKAGCTLNDDFFDKPRRINNEQNRIDKLLQEHKISSNICKIAICKICKISLGLKDASFTNSHYEAHFYKRHHGTVVHRGTPAILNLIEEIQERRFFCNLCQKDIGCEDDIVEHAEKNQEHLKRFNGQDKIKEDNNKLSYSYVTVVKSSIPTCKLCSLQVKMCNLHSHLVTTHPKDFNASMAISKSDVNKCYLWKTIKIYHCDLCKNDIGAEANIPFHISNKLHTKLLGQTQKNSSNYRNFEIKDEPNITINKYINIRSGEIQMYPLHDNVLLAKHKIISKYGRIYACKACDRDIGLKDKLLIHLHDVNHLTKLYNLEIREYKVQINNSKVLNNKKPEQQSQQLINNNNKPVTYGFEQELIKHQIIKRSNIYHCKLCMRDVGLEEKLEKHFKESVHVKHLSKIEMKENSTKNVNKSIAEIPPFSSEEISTDDAVDANDDKLREIFSSKTALIKYLEKTQNDEINLKDLTSFTTLIEEKLRNIYPHIKTYPYGPMLYGLENADSDYLSILLDTEADYCKLLEDFGEEFEEKPKHIYDYLNENLSSTFSFRYVQNDEPFIFVKIDNQPLEYVFTFVDGTGHAETKLIQYMFELQPLCKKLCNLLVKITKYYNLDVHFHTELIVWMVIFYLQVNNYLPSIKILQDNDDSPKYIGPWQGSFKRMEKYELNLSYMDEDQFFKLVKEILMFYSTVMNYDNEIICPYLGRQIQKSYLDPSTLESEFKSLKEFYETKNEDRKLSINTVVCIQHPIELNHNAAEDIYELELNAFIERLEFILYNIKW